ncbi:MAG: hypothetical protein JWN01_936 [Patescibacteria group bacterium]|nr:hypothetical protein [Patescibacteria group bacterium]
MQEFGVLSRAARFPVKSMAGEWGLPELSVTSRGVVGDRHLAVYNPATEQIVTAKAPAGAALLELGACIDPSGRIIIQPRDDLAQSALEAPGPDADELVSAWLGTEVQLVALGAGLQERPTNFRFSLRPGAGVDSSPVSLLTDVSLATMARDCRREVLEVERFRPNLFVEASDKLGDSPEQMMVGRTVRIGTVTFVGRKRTVRCPMTRMAQPGVAFDGRLLRDMQQACDGDEAYLGVYLAVVDPGCVAVGDTVYLV